MSKGSDNQNYLIAFEMQGFYKHRENICRVCWVWQICSSRGCSSAQWLPVLAIFNFGAFLYMPLNIQVFYYMPLLDVVEPVAFPWRIVKRAQRHERPMASRDGTAFLAEAVSSGCGSGAQGLGLTHSWLVLWPWENFFTVPIIQRIVIISAWDGSLGDG